MEEPIAILSSYRIELIDYILKAPTVPTILVICASRESFLQHLLADVKRVSLVSSRLDENNHATTLHRLLVPTIHLLITTKSIRLAFTPSLSHLRAYLASFEFTAKTAPHLASSQIQSSCSPVLVVLGLVALHHSTSEFSAQGLSRTVAIAVEAANLTNMKLIFAELRTEKRNENSIGDNKIVTEIRHDPWKEQVPLLNGSTGFGNKERVWASRTISIGRVIGRWCKFEKGDTEDLDD